LLQTETAINIGYSCRLLTDDMTEIHVIDAYTYEEVENQLKEAYRKMEPGNSATNHSLENRVANGCSASTSRRMEGGFAIILNGHSLVGDPDGKTISMARTLPNIFRQTLIIDYIHRTEDV
jgi:hypothetical protein